MAVVLPLNWRGSELLDTNGRGGGVKAASATLACCGSPGIAAGVSANIPTRFCLLCTSPAPHPVGRRQSPCAVTHDANLSLLLSPACSCDLVSAPPPSMLVTPSSAPELAPWDRSRTVTPFCSLQSLSSWLWSAACVHASQFCGAGRTHRRSLLRFARACRVSPHVRFTSLIARGIHPLANRLGAGRSGSHRPLTDMASRSVVAATWADEEQLQAPRGAAALPAAAIRRPRRPLKIERGTLINCSRGACRSARRGDAAGLCKGALPRRRAARRALRSRLTGGTLGGGFAKRRARRLPARFGHSTALIGAAVSADVTRAHVRDLIKPDAARRRLSALLSFCPHVLCSNAAPERSRAL